MSQAHEAAAAAEERFIAEQAAAAAKQADLQRVIEAVRSEKDNQIKDIEATRTATQVQLLGLMSTSMSMSVRPLLYAKVDVSKDKLHLSWSGANVCPASA